MIHARKDYDRIQDPASLIPEDEPVFLLRAQDETAAIIVREWADLQDDREMAALAYAHADKMDEWPKKKAADMPKGIANG